MSYDIPHSLNSSSWESGVEQLLNCLNPWLMHHWQTVLVAAKDEPFYLPAEKATSMHQIQFAHGYFNSALHELAHWCVAGSARRQLPDYGYWYEPDGRSAEQQSLFEKVEVLPQAIEWHFAQACNRPFKVSADNLTGESIDIEPFAGAVRAKAIELRNSGLNERTKTIIKLLSDEYGACPADFTFAGAN